MRRAKIADVAKVSSQCALSHKRSSTAHALARSADPMSTSSTSDASKAAAAPPGRLTGRERRDLIAAEIARHGHASCAGLARRLGVSKMTSQRDLDTLERASVVREAHGGAVGAQARVAKGAAICAVASAAWSPLP